MIEQPFQPDDLDALIRQAMKDQTAHRLGIDLANVAIQKARLFPPDATVLIASRLNRLNRLVTAVAFVLILILATWIFHSRLAAGGFQYWSTQTASDTTATSTTTDSSTTSMEWMLIGAALAIGALVVVLSQRAMNSSDEWTWHLPSPQG
jgi:hypothetical protein